ncbi:MAG TPA: hypothetical protein VGE01_10240 [Fimbriimonas sp.]
MTECFPTKAARIAIVDDFIASGKTVKTVVFWGTVSYLAQVQYPFLIAFRKNNPTQTCRPYMTTFIYQCVPVRATQAGVDCYGRKVMKFVAQLPFWFIGASGEKYWIQISERDDQSVRPGYNDFRWSFHLRTPNYKSWDSCPALGFDPALTLFEVRDSCEKSAKDMAFELWP